MEIYFISPKNTHFFANLHRYMYNMMANSTYSELIRFYGVLEDKKGIFWMIGNNWIPAARSARVAGGGQNLLCENFWERCVFWVKKGVF